MSRLLAALTLSRLQRSASQLGQSVASKQRVTRPQLAPSLQQTTRAQTQGSGLWTGGRGVGGAGNLAASGPGFDGLKPWNIPGDLSLTDARVSGKIVVQYDDEYLILQIFHCDVFLLCFNHLPCIKVGKLRN